MPNLWFRKETVLDIYNLLLALFLFATPWFVAFANGEARVDIWASSAAIAIVSIAAILAFSIWEEWLNFALGVWLILSPWALGFAHTRAMHYSIVIGSLVALVAATELLAINKEATVHGSHA